MVKRLGEDTQSSIYTFLWEGEELQFAVVKDTHEVTVSPRFLQVLKTSLSLGKDFDTELIKLHKSKLIKKGYV
jgi:hypothetical protein